MIGQLINSQGLRMPHINIDGRCSDCLCYVESSAGCQRCWPRSMSIAAETVLKQPEDYHAPWPELITAYVHEEELPVFQRLLWSVDG